MIAAALNLAVPGWLLLVLGPPFAVAGVAELRSPSKGDQTQSVGIWFCTLCVWLTLIMVGYATVATR